jgi:ankyrin repeat protein
MSTRLVDAVRAGNVEEVLRLLRVDGVPIDERSDADPWRQWTATMIACMRGRADILGILIENGANINERDYMGRTVLMIACIAFQTDIMRMLLKEHGANSNDINHNGETVLMQASLYGDADMVGMLLAAGADIDARNIRGRSAFDSAHWLGHLEVARILEAAAAHKERARARAKLLWVLKSIAAPFAYIIGQLVSERM